MLLEFDTKTDIGTKVFQAGRDLFDLTSFLAHRYDMNRKLAGCVAMFFASIATTRSDQIRQRETGIRTAKWLWATCGLKPNDPNGFHAELNCREYDPQTGIAINGGYLLPSVSIGCSCVGRVIVPGFS